MDKPYLLDTNILIQSYRTDYPFDIAPGFWKHLVKLGNDGLVAFPEEVKKEIMGSKDDLSIWLKGNETSFLTYICSEDVVVMRYNTIINLVQNNNVYYQTAKAQFADAADSWLIAVAMAYDLTIVTQEVEKPDCKNRVLIPNECKRHGINFINRLEFMRIAKFEWR